MEVLDHTTVTPQYALIVYKSRVESDGHYCELHPMVGNKMGAGQPLTEETFDSLIALTTKGRRKKEKSNESNTDFRFDNDRKLLGFSKRNKKIERLTWSIRPGVRELFFKEDLGIPSGPTPHPTLIFQLRNGEIKVFASEQTELYPESLLSIPPYFNLATDGRLCLGNTNMKVNHTSLDDQMEECENAFFNSYFSHSGDLFNKLSFNMIDFWKGMINSKQPFPLKQYSLKTTLTLEDIL